MKDTQVMGKAVFFTEWKETMYNSIEDAEKGIYYLYCSDY